MSNRKKIVITGASGFLGSHLVGRLKDNERYKVYALSSKPDDLKEKLGGENVEYIHKDLLDAEMMVDSIVINCAYPRNSTGTAIADGLRYIQRVFERAVGNDAAAIINISSQSVYSQQRTEAATEETPVCLESPYAVGKYAVELMLESICKGRKTRYTSLRMASLIGPGFNQRIVNRFLIQAYSGETLQASISSQRFGFLDVEDAVSAIVSRCDTIHAQWRPVYTVGNSESYTIKEIVDCIKRVFEEKGIDFPDVNITYEEKSCDTAVDYRQISIDTGFVPEFTLKDTVHRIINMLGF